MEKKSFLQPQHASFGKAISPKNPKHHLQLIIAQVTSPRKINPRKNLPLTRLQPAFPTGITLGANVLRQVSNILRYVCCISFMITQMTPPARHFMFFWDLESSLPSKFSRRMFSRHAKQHNYLSLHFLRWRHHSVMLYIYPHALHEKAAHEI